MVDKNHARSRRELLTALGAAGIAGVAGCSGGESGGGGGTDTADGEATDGTATGGDGGSEMDSVTAAWVYISEVGDLGWSWAHDQGRQTVDDQYDWLETEYTESVAPGDSERVFEQYAQGEADIIFGCTFEYQDPMAAVAEQYPEKYFEHNTGYLTMENMGRYMGRIYQARYLAGQAAGIVTETDTLGYVAAFPIPEVIRGINAYALGAASVNDSATLKVRWTNSWFDPPTEGEAANALLDENVDVMAQHQDSPAALRAAADAGVWATGYDAPMGDIAGENYLTSPIWHWEEFYGPTIESVRDGTWESDAYWEGLESGICSLDDWGPEVPQEAKDTVSESRSAILDGELDVWAGSAFEGESDEFLFQEMGSYVDAVEGEVPS